MTAPVSPFSIRDFRFLWGARFASTVAQNGMVVVIGWQVYDLARRTMAPKEAAFQLGMVGVCQFLPLAILTLVTGWTADRVDRRRIAQITLTTEAMCALVLGLHAWTGSSSLWVIYLVAATLGVARAFAGPAIGALAPNLVPPAVLPRAIAASSVAWQIGGIGGPALGGYLYAAAPWLPYAVSGVLFLGAGLSIGMIRPLTRTTLDRTANPWRQMVEGLHYVRRNRLVLGAISLDLFAVLLGGATAMLPIYARDILQVGAAGLGHLRGAPAIGATLAAIWFSVRPLQSNVGVKMLVAVATFGTATVVFGLSRWMPLSLFALAVLGAADMLSVYVRQSLIQLYTPNEMRGRVGAVSTLFISGSNELGEAESGLLAALIGAMPAVVLGGIGAIGITLLWSVLFPELPRARTFDPPKSREDVPTEEMVA
ncbi:MFS transporter [Sphingomonas nostoxanthinifaciens]|uniref:MFS transporter n=1 Tax=Sphingomonas nostoxanthinifaciens TaxID=2872652 RepID=UPI001CC1D6EB|nr:MFS transporter [Sphingomonas nostoxanthinifaciens]UAK25397.1 MFS transporter [Sphingomonas nostoxanthinifaciens]